MSLSIETGLKVNRDTATQMIAQSFKSNKRITEIHLRSYDRLIVATYTGQRADEMSIREDLKIIRVLKMEDRESAQ